MAYGSGARLEKMEAGMATSTTPTGRGKIVLGSVMSICLVAAIVVLAAVNMRPEETLATEGGKALKFGDSITLMNIFNEYLVVSKTGRASAGGFNSYISNNVVKILSPKGKKSAVNYGDKVVFMGPNGKYLFTRYNGLVTCRASIIASDTEFELAGGKGPILIGNLVMLKSEYGYMTAKPSGVSALAERATAMQKFTIGLPGSETGLRHANGLHFGDTIMFQDSNSEYLTADRNGWLQIRAMSTGRWSHFVVLNPRNEEGRVTYGDLVVFRAHNGRMVRAQPDASVEAVTELVDDSCQFILVGAVGHSSGIVHDQDVVAIKADFGGLIDSKNDADRVRLSPYSMMTKSTTWKVKKVWTDEF